VSGRKQFDVGTAVDQAMRVFWERGYADTSLDSLTSATGLGRGSLYGAFGNKEALFTQCLDRYSAIYGTRFEQALAAHPHDPFRAIEAFYAVTLDRIADPSVPAGCLIAQSAAQSSTLSAECGARVRSLVAAQQQRVRTSLACSSTDSQSLDELAMFVVAVNQSLAVLSRTGSPHSELRSVARLACSTVANTISAN